MTRRDILSWLVTAPSCCALVPLLASCGASATPANSASDGKSSPPANSDYYRRNAAHFIKDFRGTNEGAKAYLSGKLDPAKAQQITRRADQLFSQLLPDVPYVGGDRNRNTPFLVMAVWCVAWYRAWQPLGGSGRDVGRMLYELHAEQLKQTPQDQLLAIGAARFTPQALASAEAWARQS